MNVSRYFLVIGALYLVLGLALGMWMSASEAFKLATVHAHVNLLGFALMTIFGLAYRLIPEMAGGWMARAHFWLHQAGAIVFVIFLFLLLSGGMASERAGPVLALGELAILAGALVWLGNLVRNAR